MYNVRPPFSSLFYISYIIHALYENLNILALDL